MAATAEKPRSRVRLKAELVLEGMREIVEGDMIVHGAYATDEKDAVGPAICGGRKFCAVGSFAVAAGIVPFSTDWSAAISDNSTRAEVFSPAARRAWHAIEDAAGRYAEERDIPIEESYCDCAECRNESVLERLFEDTRDEDDDYLIGRGELLEVIDRALVSL